MSWRRFLVLCRNLSPYGAVAMRISEKNTEEPDNEMDARQAAEEFFSSVVHV
jgi:hypothetical protein